MRQVIKAYDGQDAYDEIVKHGGPDAFDVILMDLHMPRMVRRSSIWPSCHGCHSRANCSMSNTAA